MPTFVFSNRKWLFQLEKKYRTEGSADIERYVENYCGIYSDNIIVDRLKKLSTMSLGKAYLYIKNCGYFGNYFINLKYHLSAVFEQRCINLDGLLLHDFEDDSNLELAPDYDE